MLIIATVFIAKTIGYQKPDRGFACIDTLLTNFYHNVLHRAPDQAGFDYWLSQLNNHDITPAGALASFSTSIENQALVIGSIQNGIEYIPWLA